MEVAWLEFLPKFLYLKDLLFFKYISFNTNTNTHTFEKQPSNEDFHNDFGPNKLNSYKITTLFFQTTNGYMSKI